MSVCSRLKLRKVKVVLVILDCCLEFHEGELADSTRGASHHAVGDKSFGGTIVAYSCSPGGRAIVGLGDYGT